MMLTGSIKEKVDFYINVVARQAPFFYKIHKKNGVLGHYQIIGMVRERNESLLLGDTLDHLSQFVDAIVVFDDASTDDSVEIAMNHPAVIEVIQSKFWRKENRIWEEASNRKKLLSRARKYNPQWLFYCDADERFEGDIKNFLRNECPAEVDSIRISLFDAYITENDQEPYTKGEKLYNFRAMFGPERRDIIMLWRNKPNVVFNQKDGREPQNISKNQITKFTCQHYGKSLSIQQWEETCDYYISHFPKYRDKWKARKGKAIHHKSDFGRKLYAWSEVMSKSTKIN